MVRPTTSAGAAYGEASRGNQKATLSNPNLQVPSANTDNSLTDAGQQSTEALIRQVLCPAGQDENSSFQNLRPISELLPPLTTSNDVDFELYAYIAIIVKENVYAWYGQFTADQAFVEEVLHIVAHCTRALEQRLRKLDLDLLLLDEIPKLLEAHVRAWRFAKQAATSPRSPFEVQHIYQTLRPHPAVFASSTDDTLNLSEDQEKADREYRQLLAQGLLAVLLPTEELRNPCLFSLVSEILGGLVLGNYISQRACESDFIYESIRKLADWAQTRSGRERWLLLTDGQPKDRLETFGLVSNDESSREKKTPSWTSVKQILWLLIQYTWMTLLGLRMVVVALSTASTLPARSRKTVASPTAGVSPDTRGHEKSARSHSPLGRTTGLRGSNQPWPILSLGVWSTAATLLCIDVRLPWLWSLVTSTRLLVLQGPGRLGDSNGRIDR